MSTLSAIILAGGHSRRMGQDKALLTMPDGQLLLQRTARLAQQLTADTVVITPWPERYQPVLPPTVRLVKEQTAIGPLGGFAQGWNQVHSDWCLLLACDLPYLEFAALQHWWQWLTIALTEPPPDELALSETPPSRPSTDSPGKHTPVMASLVPGTKGWEPLCGYYHRSCLPGLHRQMAGSNRSFQSWLAKIPITPYRLLPASMLFNCNTPNDWGKVK